MNNVDDLRAQYQIRRDGVLIPTATALERLINELCSITTQG
jgi:hypothetical protein